MGTTRHVTSHCVRANLFALRNWFWEMAKIQEWFEVRQLDERISTIVSENSIQISENHLQEKITHSYYHIVDPSYASQSGKGWPLSHSHRLQLETITAPNILRQCRVMANGSCRLSTSVLPDDGTYLDVLPCFTKEHIHMFRDWVVSRTTLGTSARTPLRTFTYIAIIIIWFTVWWAS